MSESEMSPKAVRLQAVLEDMVAPQLEGHCKLELLADWLDKLDRERGVVDEDGVQRDLRRWAQEIRETAFNEHVGRGAATEGEA